MNKIDRSELVYRVQKNREQIEYLEKKSLPDARKKASICAAKGWGIFAAQFANLIAKLEAENVRLKAQIDADLRALARDE